MVFSSLLFLSYFLPVFLLTYFLTPKKIRNYTLLAWSLLFYAWGGPAFFILLIVLSYLNYQVIKRIPNAENKRKKKGLLLLSLFFNVGSLVYFKYVNFFIENVQTVQSWFGFDAMEWTAVALPIGISFFTFHSLTYTMDVYQNVHKPLAKFSDYLLFILNFPQMIAGPIVQYHTIADEIISRRENVDEFLEGFMRFAIGLAKKILIANILASQADAILNEYQNYDSIHIWIGMLAYTFQIYFDFSGYSDMAVGLGKMIGFHFPENFNNPYTSRSISEFWRNWHITLGQWMKNYLYIPLGGNRSPKKWRNLMNLATVFVLSGLWHGASWNFILWGCFHGFFLVIDKLFFLKWMTAIGKIPSVLITFVIVLLGWVLFRMNTFSEAIGVYKKLFSFDTLDPLFIKNSVITTFIIAALFSFFVLLPKGKQIQNFIFQNNQIGIKTQTIHLVITIVLLLLSMIYLAPGGMNPFIYYRF